MTRHPYLISVITYSAHTQYPLVTKPLKLSRMSSLFFVVQKKIILACS